jgi:L-malate glycosyltransferase
MQRDHTRSGLAQYERVAPTDGQGRRAYAVPRFCSILQLAFTSAKFVFHFFQTETCALSASGTRSLVTETPLDRSRISVLLMTNTLEVGGSERQFVTLVESLSRDHFEVHPACLKRIGGFAARMGRIPEFPPGGRLLGIQSQRAQFEMVRAMRRDGIAVAHAFDFYTNMMLIPAARLAGVPVIGSHRQLGDLLSSAKFKAQYWAFRFCHRVVCNSQAAADSLRAASLPEEKLVVIPNGLREQAFAACAPAIPRKPGIVRVGMIARMNNAVKNHPAFLQAAAKLSQRFPAVEFLLVGDGPLRPGLEQMAAELGIKEKVIFAGERHDIPAMLASLDVSVLISSSESLSNVILESMAAGVPVVATDVGGNPELVKHGETGLLVPPGDEEKLVEALAQLVRDSDLRSQYAARSKDFARSHFHVDEVCRRFEQLYVSLAKGRH